MARSSKANAVDYRLIDRSELQNLCGEQLVVFNLSHTATDIPFSLHPRTFSDGSRGSMIGAGVIAFDFKAKVSLFK